MVLASKSLGEVANELMSDSDKRLCAAYVTPALAAVTAADDTARSCCRDGLEEPESPCTGSEGLQWQTGPSY